MAVSFVQAATQTGTAATVVIQRPTSATDGDLLILTIATVAGISITTAPNGGWTNLLNGNVTGSASADFSHSKGYIYYKVANGEPLSYSATVTFGGDGWATNIMAFRGVRSASPVEVTTQTHSISGNAIVCPALTLSASGGALVAVGVKYSALVSGWAVGTFINGGSSIISHVVDTNQLIAAYNVGPWAAGNTGTVTLSAQDSDSIPSWVGFTIGLVASSTSTPSPLVRGSLSLLGVGI